MRNKIIALSLILNLIPLSLFSQISIGLEAGYSRNSITGNLNNNSYTIIKPANSLQIGVLIDVHLNDKILFKTGVSRLEKNYSFVRTGSYNGIYYSFSNSYIQIPLVLSYQVSANKTFFFFNGGIYSSYWLSARTFGVTPNIFDVDDVINNGNVIETFGLIGYDQKYEFNSSKDRRIEIGLTCGFGIDQSLNKNTKIRLQTNFYDSVTDQQKTYMLNQDKRFNKTIVLDIALIRDL